MKLQIDAIVAKSEALMSESNSEEYNRQLTDNGDCLLILFCVKNYQSFGKTGNLKIFLM